MPVGAFKVMVSSRDGPKRVVAIKAPESAAPERTMESLLRTMLEEDDPEILARLIFIAARNTKRSPLELHTAFPVGVRALVREVYERVKRVLVISDIGAARVAFKRAVDTGERIVLYEDATKAAPSAKATKATKATKAPKAVGPEMDQGPETDTALSPTNPEGSSGTETDEE